MEPVAKLTFPGGRELVLKLTGDCDCFEDVNTGEGAVNGGGVLCTVGAERGGRVGPVANLTPLGVGGRIEGEGFDAVGQDDNFLIVCNSSRLPYPG